MTDSPRPNFFLVGSMKSGTTSLQRYLKTHPDIFMTEDPKEPSYFLDYDQLMDVLPGLEKRKIWESEDNYLALFCEAGSCPVIGEASANYARLNRVKDVPERIATFSPDARILFIARDPIERTISHYWYMVRFFGENRGMLQAVREDPDYTDTSNYALQLNAWLACFPENRVMFVTMEALRDRPRETMRDIFKWLGVDQTFIPPNLRERANTAPPVVSQVRGFGVLHRFRHSRIWNAVGPRIPGSIRRLARRFSEKEMVREDVDRADVEQYLRPIQLPQTQELGQLLGREFPEWTTLYAD